MFQSHPRTVIAGAALLVLAAVTSATGETAMLKPDWNAPEVKQFLESKSATRRLGAEEAAPRDQVKLPVLEFKQAPEAATRSMRSAGVQAEEEPVFISDENNPVWYQTTQTFGGITVTIEADLRVQQKEVPEGIETGSATRGLAPAETDVAIYSDAAEEGTPGYVAEYTVEKFGIPYSVRIECTAEIKAECADKGKIAATQALLAVTGGSP